MAVAVGKAFFLIASWINCMLYTAEIVTMVQYFQQRSRSILHRLSVCAIFVFDTICTGAICAEVYVSVLATPCKALPVYTEFTTGTLATELFSTYATASSVQLFMCYLYFVITKKRLIAGILVFPVAFHTVFSYLSAILVVANNSPFPTRLAFLTSEHVPFFVTRAAPRLSTVVRIGAISCAITDILIASSLLYTLIRMEITSAIRRSTKSLLHRLMILIFTSGAVVASCTLASMICLLSFNPAYPLFFFTQGRVYSLTLLGNFILGMPLQPPMTTVHAPSVVTGVVFHLEHTNHRDNSTDDNPRTHSMDVDMDLLTLPHVKSQPDSE
ncbi:hypothetical protein C8R43DRAFT_1244814 [Mycena crocata]|nr:hypothetical protein C8R43DRAFT_1244814 [Mycena crocata]